MKEDYKVDPLSIKVDQTKQDTRRDAWDRDYLPHKEMKKVEPPRKDYTILLCFAFFFISVLVMIGSKS